MITIGQRVLHSIDEMARDQFEFALTDAAIAIDLTAKRFYQKSKHSGQDYKNLLLEYSWLLELMAFGGINLKASKFGNFPIKNNNKLVPEPSMAELIYHIIRCCLIHEEGLPFNFKFHNQDGLWLAKEEMILPIKLIWGLLAIAVFCSANKEEVTRGEYFFTIFEENFLIASSWGKEKLAKIIYDQKNLPKVTIDFPYNHFFEPVKPPN